MPKKIRTELIEDEENDINEFDMLHKAADVATDLFLKQGWHIPHGAYKGPRVHQELLHEIIFAALTETYLAAVNSPGWGPFQCRGTDKRLAILKCLELDGRISFETICYLGPGR
jgi:hypothetical protein